MMRANLKPAIISAVVVAILAGLLLGIRLNQQGTTLSLVGAGPDVYWKIGAAAAFLFFFNLFRDQLSALWKGLPGLPKAPQKLVEVSHKPALRRLFWCFMIAAAIIWPFLSNRGGTDLGTLVLIYVMLGLGLNIVVGLAGLLDLGYVGFYAVGAYGYALMAMYFDVGFWTGLLVAGLLAALFERKAGRGRSGRTVDVALTESILSMLEGCLPEYGYMNRVRQPQGSTIPTAAPSSAYPSRDGRWFIIGANSEALYARLCEVMDRPDMKTDPRYVDNPSRVRHMPALDAEIGAWTQQFTVEELEEKISGADIPSTRIYDMADVAADPQFVSRAMVQPVQDARLGEVLHPGVVPKMPGPDNEDNAVRWAGPRVGEHNDDVLGSVLGLDQAEIDRLRKEDII